jgi:hypothetical protein
MVWKYTIWARFPSAVLDWLSFCKHASNRKKRLHERTYRSSGTPTSLVTETKEPLPYKVTLCRIAGTVFSQIIMLISLDTWKTFILIRKMIPSLLYNYSYSACSLLINYCISTWIFCFGNSGYFKVVFGRRMGPGGDVAQRRILSSPLSVTIKCNKTL